ncbi:complement factor H-related protein 1-like isoform X2 [Vanacampus margaritifer]
MIESIFSTLSENITNPDKMFLRFLGFVLVLSYPGESHAKECLAPQLERGFLLPQLESYSHGSRLTYACNTGYRPLVESWWATSVCLDGLWTHTPQCIDEKFCLPPNIPNGKSVANSEGLWYEDGKVVWIKCDEGYKSSKATVTCQKGTWPDLPTCERSDESCDEPPKIPHAVVILHKYQDIFAGGTEVQYECEDGYSVETAIVKKSIVCDVGVWSEPSSCRSATTSDKTDSTRSPLVTAVANCGRVPHVPNGDVVQSKSQFIKYACNAFYKMIGPKKVMCYRNGTWSEQPTCKEAFCQVDLDVYKSDYSLQESGTIFVKEGETKKVQCIWPYFFSRITCVKQKERITQCCLSWVNCS